MANHEINSIMMILLRALSCYLLFHYAESAVFNAAYKKPSWQSSTDYSWSADRANDGDSNNDKDMYMNSCSRTNESVEDVAWWQVDLQKKYTITHVILTTRDWDDGPRRLAGFSIYTSKDKKEGNWTNEELCFHDKTGQSHIAQERRINCKKSIEGRYVVIYNKRPVDGGIRDASENAILELCEVDVPVDVGNCSNLECTSCEAGWYGEECKHTCGHCGDDGGCNKDSGHCNSDSCQAGYFGRNCTRQCPPNCYDNERCNFNTGECTTCKNPYYGQLCDKKCPDKCVSCTIPTNCNSCKNGWYGSYCSLKCLNCGGSGECNKLDGRCISLSCKVGFYGSLCNQSCSDKCKGNGSCRFSTGHCTQCPIAKYGVSCNRNCPINCNSCENSQKCNACAKEFYGSTCDKNCFGCGGDGLCRQTNGICISSWCKPKYYGLQNNYAKCNEKCPSHCGGNGSCNIRYGTCKYGCKSGYWTSKCDRPCSSNCGGDGSCNFSNGYCINGCTSGYWRSKCDRYCPSNCGGDGSCNIRYRTCSNGCKRKYWRRLCDLACPSNCGGDGSCNIFNGICNYGCKTGHWRNGCDQPCPSNCGGDGSCSFRHGSCSTGCKPGYWGKTCDQPCPLNCGGEGSCKQYSKMCEEGCRLGYMGSFCNESCSSNCKNKSCDRNTGYCLHNCNDGWFGLQCREDCPIYCGKNRSCDRSSGECLNECKNGWFGQHCNKSCPENCGGSSCNKIDGACVNECMTPFYGPQCTLDCPVNCDGDRSCNKENGICKYGCTPGWNGPLCESECEFPHFGNYCMEDCGNCRNQSCHHINGTCMLGCEDGWFSQYCDIESNGAGVMGLIVMVGSGGAVFILAVSIVLVLVLLRKRGNRKEITSDASKTDDGGINAGSDKVMHNATYASILPVGDKIGAFSPINDGAKPGTTQFETIEDLGRTYYNTDEIPKGIKISELKGYFIEKRLTKKLDAEFKALPNGSIHPTTVAELPQNMKKNRFKNTLPYDHSRVRLQGKMDFINANFIEDASGIKRYIATQGPIKKTIEDFWQMIWENNIDKIVMLTNLLEGEKKKCEQYWPNPNEKMTGGQYGLTLKDERIFSYYTLRELQIVDNKSKEKRDILQYHFTTWPDHGTPDPLLLILFQKRVTSTAPKYDGPILVHCSAGIGRTGTFIALDALASHGANTGVVDIENYVRIMRKDRMNMIQTSEQYKVLHEALIEAFQWNDTSISMDEFPSIWRSMDSYKSPLNQQLLKKEYDMLREMNIVSEDEMSLTALKEENKIKNRSVNILPLDKHRPYLTTYCSGRNDYINAVIIPSHISKEAFMVTQVPLPGTIVDFWRLITDIDSRCIIYFASSSDEETDFFPARVNSTETESHLIQKESMTFLQQSVEETKMTVQNKKSNQTTEVLMLKIDMADRGFPSVSQIFRAAEVVELQRRRYKHSPCTVIAFYGCTPCEVFCAFSNILEYMKVDNRIDVFQTARQLQIRRPEFFSKFETYRYCYQIVNEYLTTQSVYCNN